MLKKNTKKNLPSSHKIHLIQYESSASPRTSAGGFSFCTKYLQIKTKIRTRTIPHPHPHPHPYAHTRAHTYTHTE